MSSSRAWVDVLTPKQVLFFAPVVDDLKRSGCEVLVTSRRYRELEPLARRAKLDLKFVGERGGRGVEAQLIAATERQAEMIPIVRDFRPAVAVSVASGVCARVAYGLRIKHVAVNDSPHSEIAGRLAIPVSYHLLCPWVIPYRAWRKFGLAPSQVSTYHALDPAAWLKRKPIGGPVPKLDPRKKTITVRIPETDAPYMIGKDASWSDSVLRSLAEAFPDLNLVALCRYDYQVEAVKKKFGRSYTVPSYVVSGQGLLAATDVFVGMGGTMSAEAALMGVPTISAFQGSLYTERYLRSVGLVVRAATPYAIASDAKRFLKRPFKANYAKEARRVLDSMEDPVPKIATFILKTAEQG
ncbi:MAG: DUF354 domain-containing protein [Thaumarchaeota archaeon]|nr:DUF354 domain-containing protein [Nitrososphaerota archaeon]